MMRFPQTPDVKTRRNQVQYFDQQGRNNGIKAWDDYSVARIADTKYRDARIR
jgi:hypothetical protein